MKGSTSKKPYVSTGVKYLSPEWETERHKLGIGGSEAAAIAGLNPYSSAFTVYWDKLGKSEPIEISEAMRQGSDLEEYVAKRFCEATGKKVRKCEYMLQSAEHPFMIADVDRFVVGENAILECKTSRNASNYSYEDANNIPAYQLVQCLHYMSVVGAEKAYRKAVDHLTRLLVEDNAIVLNAISGHDRRDATSLARKTPDFASEIGKGAKGLRVGLPKEFFAEGISPQVKDAVLHAAHVFAQLGAQVQEVSMPSIPHALSAYYIISSAEASSNLARFDGIRYGYRAKDFDDITDLYLKSRSEGFGKEVKRRIMLGTFALSSGYYDAYYKKALQVRSLVTADFRKVFEQNDFILSPVAPTPAYKIGEKSADPLEMYMGDAYSVPVNIAGVPALSLPCGKTETGLPIGCQLIGAAFSEPLLYRAGAALEEALKERM